MPLPNEHESTAWARWQGKVDGFMETTPARIQSLFESDEVLKDKIQLVREENQKDTSDLARIVSNLTGKLVVIVAVAASVGTMASSLLVAAIIKIFLKP